MIYEKGDPNAKKNVRVEVEILEEQVGCLFLGMDIAYKYNEL